MANLEKHGMQDLALQFISMIRIYTEASKQLAAVEQRLKSVASSQHALFKPESDGDIIKKQFALFEGARDRFELSQCKDASAKSTMHAAAEILLSYDKGLLIQESEKDFHRLAGFVHNKKLSRDNVSYRDQSTKDRYGLSDLRDKIALPTLVAAHVPTKVGKK